MKLLVGYLQFKPEKGKPEVNIDKVHSFTKDADFDILVLPELAFSGYFFLSREEILPFADEGFTSKPVLFLRELSRREKALVISGMAEKQGNRLFNSQYAFFPDGGIVVYRKTHLFFKEKLIFEPGDTGPVLVEYKGVKVGLLICFDWIFPEFARVLSLKGAHILVNSANLVLPGLGQKGMTVRAIENRVFSILANRIGSEIASSGESITFTGMSQVIDPMGQIIISSTQDEEVVKVAEIDPTLAENKWITPYNHIIKDRRVEYYKDLIGD